MQNRLIAILLIVLGTLALSGCLEDFQVTLHEPGVYMGPEDELLESSHSSALAERLSAGQMDR